MIEYNFLMKKRILYFIFGLRRSLKNNVWLGLILLTWTLVVQHTADVSNTIPTVTKVHCISLQNFAFASDFKILSGRDESRSNLKRGSSCEQLLQCAFTGSTLWVLKVLLVKILANSFHRSAYFDRIQDSLFHQYILEVLSEPRSHRIARSASRGPDGRRRGAPVFKVPRRPNAYKCYKFRTISSMLTSSTRFDWMH